MYSYDPEQTEEEIYEEELEEAERMIRNGAGLRQLMRKQFTRLGQSDIYKLFRKFGRDPENDESDYY